VRRHVAGLHFNRVVCALPAPDREPGGLAQGRHLPVHLRSLPHFVDHLKVQALKLALLLPRFPPALAAQQARGPSAHAAALLQPRLLLELAVGAHSSVYDCLSPSGYTPLGKSFDIGTVGGLVCCSASFPASACASCRQTTAARLHSRKVAAAEHQVYLCPASSRRCRSQQGPLRHARSRAHAR